MKSRGQVFLGLLAFADIEHETDQCFDFPVLAHHMHHIAYPHVLTVAGQGAVVGIMVDPGLGLRDVETHHVLMIDQDSFQEEEARMLPDARGIKAQARRGEGILPPRDNRRRKCSDAWAF